jgi:two-component system response regulator WspF
MRIAIVNDMPLAVEALRRVVGSVPEYEVAWIARDGDTAVRQCAADVRPRPDGSDDAADGRRGGDASHHAAIAVRDSCRHGDGRRPRQQGVRGDGLGSLDAVDTPVLGLAGDPAGARPLLTKIAMLSKLTGQSAALDGD